MGKEFKVKIYERMKLYDKALQEIDLYNQHAETRTWKDKVEKENTIKFLKREYDRIFKMMK